MQAHKHPYCAGSEGHRSAAIIRAGPKTPRKSCAPRFRMYKITALNFSFQRKGFL